MSELEKLREWIRQCSLMYYKLREDLHHHIEEDRYGREFSKVIDFYTDAIVLEYHFKNEEYFDSDLFLLHCSVLLVDSDIIKRQVCEMWRNNEKSIN